MNKYTTSRFVWWITTFFAGLALLITVGIMYQANSNMGSTAAIVCGIIYGAFIFFLMFASIGDW